MADITKALRRMGRNYEEILGLRRLLTDAAEKIDSLQAENQRLRAELEKAIERLEQGKPCLAKNILYCALDRPQTKL